jgi:hypothetical protein
MENMLFSLNALSNRLVEALSSLGVYYIILFNAFGVIATCLKASEYQLKTRKAIITFAALASCCWATYFILQGDFTSALANIAIIAQNLVFMQRGKKKWASSIFWLFFFIIVQILICVTSFKTLLDLFPILGGILGAIAYFVLKEKTYRYIVFASVICWLLNSLTKGYLIASISDSIGTLSVLIAIIRFTIEEKKLKKSEQNDKEKITE